MFAPFYYRLQFPRKYRLTFNPIKIFINRKGQIATARTVLWGEFWGDHLNQEDKMAGLSSKRNGFNVTYRLTVAEKTYRN